MLACIGLLLAPSPVLCFSARRRMLGPSRVREPSNRPELAAPEIEVGEWLGPWNATVHDVFMRDFWQKRPLLVRGAFPELRESPLMSPDELRQIACVDEEFYDDEVDTADGMSYSNEDFEAGLDIGEDDKDVAARLILNQREVIHGPFDSDDLEELCTAHPGAWSLLVNDLERHSPRVHELVEAFSLVPTWRHDDVMISLAPTGGGIGAHVDSYDVFLLQGSGTREWEVESRYLSLEDETASLINDGRAVRVLQSNAFRATHRWILEPGDFLYLPPRVAHRGKSLSNDCTTVSIGFRLPAVRELVAYFADYVTRQGRRLDASGARLKYGSLDVSSDVSYVPDVGILPESSSSSIASSEARSSGCIDPSGVAEAKEVIRAALLAELDDDEAFDQWFGSTVILMHESRTSVSFALQLLFACGSQCCAKYDNIHRSCYRERKKLRPCFAPSFRRSLRHSELTLPCTPQWICLEHGTVMVRASHLPSRLKLRARSASKRWPAVIMASLHRG